MTRNGIELEIWLRSDQHASTRTIDPPVGEPADWTDHDVEAVLTGMLRAMHQAQDPTAPADATIALRGFSWIVNPYEGGVLIALELSIGAVVAGPFDIADDVLTKKIARVMSLHRPSYVPPGLTIQ